MIYIHGTGMEMVSEQQGGNIAYFALVNVFIHAMQASYNCFTAEAAEDAGERE